SAPALLPQGRSSFRPRRGTLPSTCGLLAGPDQINEHFPDTAGCTVANTNQKVFRAMGPFLQRLTPRHASGSKVADFPFCCPECGARNTNLFTRRRDTSCAM